MLEKIEIINQMKSLWKSTFGDPQEYIDNVFDNYFDINYVEYEERGGKIISAMLGVPYNFESNNHKLSALYLCGLATDISFRGQGLMKNLIEKICKRASDNGFDFVFLIPANKSLIKYYEDRGFTQGIYHSINRFTSIHDFKKELKDEDGGRELQQFISSKIEAIDYDDCKCVNRVINYLIRCEIKCSNNGDEDRLFTLRHDGKDWAAVISDMKLYGNDILVSKDENNDEINGVGFIDYHDDEIIVKNVIADGRGVACKILSHVVANNSVDLPITVIGNYLHEERVSLWQPYYNASLPDAPTVGAVGEVVRISRSAGESKMYGMLRLTNVSNLLKIMVKRSSELKNENLTLLTDTSDYSILLNSKEKYRISRNFNCKTTANYSYLQQTDCVRLTWEEMAEIVFRPENASNQGNKLFGLPQIALNMSLLLD